MTKIPVSIMREGTVAVIDIRATQSIICCQYMNSVFPDSKEIILDNTNITEIEIKNVENFTVT